MTDHPPDPDPDGSIHTDDDPHQAEVRELLRTELPTIDPVARERALAAAMAAADEPPLTVDPSQPRPGQARPLRDDESGPTLPTPSTVSQLDARRAGRLRVLAIAAAVVVVVAGAAAVNWDQVFDSSSNTESAEDAATVTGSADADSADRSAGTDSAESPSDASGSAESGVAAEAPSLSTTTAPAADRSGELPSLGTFDDLAALFGAAATIGGSDGAGGAFTTATGVCGDVLSSLVVQGLATATFRDAPVLVVRALGPSGRPVTMVLSSESCQVLAQG
jgi:hypothetical protein